MSEIRVGTMIFFWRIALVIIGFLPLLLGYLHEYLMMTVYRYNPPGALGSGFIMLSGYAVIIIWFFAGVLSAKAFKSNKEPLLLLNAAGIFAAALVLVQMLVLAYFWNNFMGLLSQFFFLPFFSLHLVRLVFIMLSWLVPNFMLLLVFSSLFCLIFAFWLGFRYGKSRAA